MVLKQEPKVSAQQGAARVDQNFSSIDASLSNQFLQAEREAVSKTGQSAYFSMLHRVFEFSAVLEYDRQVNHVQIGAFGDSAERHFDTLRRIYPEQTAQMSDRELALSSAMLGSGSKSLDLIRDSLFPKTSEESALSRNENEAGLLELKEVLHEVRKIFSREPRHWGKQAYVTLQRHIRAAKDNESDIHPLVKQFVSSYLPQALEIVAKKTEGIRSGLDVNNECLISLAFSWTCMFIKETISAV